MPRIWPNAEVLTHQRKMLKLYKRKNLGFTVIEAIVATAVFAVAISAIVGAFASVMRLNNKSRSMRAVEQNARFISEFLTREIRNGAIDFGASGYNGTIPNSGKVTTLYLISHDNQTESLTLTGNKMTLTKAGSITNLSGSDISVLGVNFYIRPTTAGDQELVTFAFVLTSSSGTATADKYTATFQSSAAARDY